VKNRDCSDIMYVAERCRWRSLWCCGVWSVSSRGSRPSTSLPPVAKPPW